MRFASAIDLTGNVISVDHHELLSKPVEEIKAVRPAMTVAGGRVVYAA